jgi:hypothetical protein
LPVRKRTKPATWSPGRYEPRVEHLIKYESEFKAATA